MLQTTGETDLPLGTIFAALMLSMSSGGIVCAWNGPHKVILGTDVISNRQTLRRNEARNQRRAAITFARERGSDPRDEAKARCPLICKCPGTGCRRAVNWWSRRGVSTVAGSHISRV